MLAVACLFVGSPLSAAEPDAKIPPIQTVKARPGAKALDEGGAKKPIVIRTADEAGKYFEGDALAVLKKEVDFAQQVVLVFAWRGSGQDRLDCSVAESSPEQVLFQYKRGRTRDLRPHVQVYALRSNVKWRF